MDTLQSGAGSNTLSDIEDSVLFWVLGGPVAPAMHCHATQESGIDDLDVCILASDCSATELWGTATERGSLRGLLIRRGAAEIVEGIDLDDGVVAGSV